MSHAREFYFFFFSSRRRHTISVSAFLLNRSSDLRIRKTRYKQASHFVHIPGLSYSGVKSPTECQQSLFESHFASRQRSEERRVGKECRSRWWPYHNNNESRMRILGS